MPKVRKVVLGHFTAAGDIVCLTACIKALHESHPGAFETMYTGHHGQTSPSGNNLFANNPYVTILDPAESEYIKLDYGYSIQRCSRPKHFLHGFVDDLSFKLGVSIELMDYRGDIWLSPEETVLWPGLPDNYAIIDAGYKNDFTAKHWSTHRYQEVVNATKDRITWVQIGSAQDNHAILNNCVNLVGQTSLRDLCRLMYRAKLVLTPVSLPMHLAAAVPTPQDGPRMAPMTVDEMHRRRALEMSGQPVPDRHEHRKNRPCIVLMGNREPENWEGYPNHLKMGTWGKLGCGVDNGTGCWRNKLVKVDNDTSICFNPLKDEAGAWVPECLHRVTINDVVKAIDSVL